MKPSSQSRDAVMVLTFTSVHSQFSPA